MTTTNKHNVNPATDRCVLCGRNRWNRERVPECDHRARQSLAGVEVALTPQTAKQLAKIDEDAAYEAADAEDSRTADHSFVGSPVENYCRQCHRGREWHSQPAPDTSGEWHYIETRHGAEVDTKPLRLRAHWDGLVEPEDIRELMRQVVRDHRAVPVLVGALTGIRDCARGIMPIYSDLNQLRQVVIDANDARWTRLYAILITTEAALAIVTREPANIRQEPQR